MIIFLTKELNPFIECVNTFEEILILQFSFNNLTI